MSEISDLLTFDQYFLLQLLVLRFSLLSACNGVVGLQSELSQLLIDKRVRSVPMLR
jgi:hypothetical protein